MIAVDAEIRPLYRAMLILGAVAIVILGLGLIEFLAFEPLGEHSGITVRVDGVFYYDPSSHETTGGDRSRFDASEDFAAVVDWSSAPSGTVVGASWFSAIGSAVGQVGPKPAGEMTEQDRTVPVKVPPGLTRNVPGEYVFVVERYRGHQPVEVLARRLVLVRRSP